jgi:hypothetical protein
MRFSILTFFAIISFVSKGQKVEYRNDSLFINSFYVNTVTSKLTLDSLLNDKGKIDKSLGKYNPLTKERMKQTRYMYKRLGLIFYKNDYDSTRLLISLKLYRNSNEMVDQNNMPTKPFEGELFIAGNFMNDKRTIEQLQKLNNCKLEYKQSHSTVFGHPATTTIAYLIYQESLINILFDSDTNQTTCIFISHNPNIK